MSQWMSEWINQLIRVHFYYYITRITAIILTIYVGNVIAAAIVVIVAALVNKLMRCAWRLSGALEILRLR